MKIIIRNPGQPKVPTQELRDAAKFYTKLLLTERQSKHVTLKIKLADTGYDKGYIEWLDRPVKPKEFLITLSNKFKTRETLKSLAHEMTHMKQFIVGDLTDETLRSLPRWKREEVVLDKMDYFDYPWEIDAFGREVGLYVRYMRWRKSISL
jgi:hypothetical protein